MLPGNVAALILARERAAEEVLRGLRDGGVTVTTARGDEYVLALLRSLLDVAAVSRVVVEECR